MHCFVYRSNRKLDTYLYIIEKDKFEEIPEPLMNVFGRPEFALSFYLTPKQKLAQGNTEQVIANIKENGFHLQMPPENEEPM